jgi:beta-glucosidase
MMSMTFLRKRFLVLLCCCRCFLTAAQQQHQRQQQQSSIEEQVESLLSQMSLRDKIGQMIMDAENTFETPVNIGAYLIGASDAPPPNTPSDWRQRLNELNEISSNTALNIPILVGTDAVHGQNIVSGGTIFPHNIGLGATRNTTLVQEMARITALEMHATGLDLTFAPTIAVARTMTWGRTYEAFSEDTQLVSELGAAYIQGLQQQGTTNKIATAKHWIGDGGTAGGVNAGDTPLQEDELLSIHGQPYVAAIAQNVGAIMVSFSSVLDQTMHGHTRLIQEVLKGDLGFQGFVLSDWEGYLHNEPADDYPTQVQVTINAGIDMLMCAYQGYVAMESILNGVNDGIISTDRIDDAARRILRVKFQHGIMDRPVWDVDNTPPVGTDEHRAVARQAVRESLVLLKNENGALPLDQSSTILVTGKNAHNVQNQCGGWTMYVHPTITLSSYLLTISLTHSETFPLVLNSSMHTLAGLGKGIPMKLVMPL